MSRNSRNSISGESCCQICLRARFLLLAGGKPSLSSSLSSAAAAAAPAAAGAAAGAAAACCCWGCCCPWLLLLLGLQQLLQLLLQVLSEQMIWMLLPLLLLLLLLQQLLLVQLVLLLLLLLLPSWCSLVLLVLKMLIHAMKFFTKSLDVAWIRHKQWMRHCNEGPRSQTNAPSAMQYDLYSQALILKLDICMPTLMLQLIGLLRVAALGSAMAEQRQQQQQQQEEGQRQTSRGSSLHRFAAAPLVQMAVIWNC